MVNFMSCMFYHNKKQMNEQLIYTVPPPDFKCTIFSKRSQTQVSSYGMVPLM